jgi:glycosyltransferase involved in cell wall biosynthesis
MLLAVNVIVRDEAAHLSACLASVREVADVVVVHDTGSRDDSVAVAWAAGATVVEGRWEDDFASARNVALAASRAPWVLALDADERWQGRRDDLHRALLLELAAGREGELPPLLTAYGDRYAGELVTELESLGDGGRVLAQALRAKAGAV